MRTPALERWLHHAATILVGASGLAYGWAKYLAPAPEDPFSVVNHPIEPWALDAHVLAAPLAVLAFGLLLRDHVLGRLLGAGRRSARRSGVLLTALIVPMAASGYLLQTATSPAWITGLVVVHLASSCVYLAGYAVHWIVALRRPRNGRTRG